MMGDAKIHKCNAKHWPYLYHFHGINIIFHGKFVLQCKTMYICIMDEGNKIVNINLRVTEGTKASLLKLAESDRRTLSDFIRLQLEKLTQTPKK
jgi:hypothetical protein